MDRLTGYKNGVCVYTGPGCKYQDTGEIPAELDAGSVRAALQRLAAYEDTGLLPEEIADFRENYRAMSAQFADYKAAEVTGQLFILPCRVTDTVYTIESCLGAEIIVGGRRMNFPQTDRVVSAQINRVMIEGDTGKAVYDLSTETDGWFMSIEQGEFFLTQEEAEKELERRKNGEAD